jgi:hypothetical protein
MKIKEEKERNLQRLQNEINEKLEGVKYTNCNIANFYLFGYEISISYLSPKPFIFTGGIKPWIFHFHTYKYIFGFITRICGVYFNIRERNAFSKLINKKL